MSGRKQLVKKRKPVREEQTGGLYDFVYKDVPRLASYYSQIFSGLVASEERSTSQSQETQFDAKFSAMVVTADALGKEQTGEIRKQIIDPRDLIATDVLAHLTQTGKVSRDLAGAKNGQLVSATGQLLLIDSSILGVVEAVFDAQIRVLQNAPDTEGAQDVLMYVQYMKDIASKLAYPEIFMMKAERGIQVGGTLQAAGLQDPVSAFNIKHGFGGLSDMTIIGIKEQAGPEAAFAHTEFSGAVQGYANELKKLLFTDQTIRILPLAIFRTLA